MEGRSFSWRPLWYDLLPPTPSGTHCGRRGHAQTSTRSPAPSQRVDEQGEIASRECGVDAESITLDRAVFGAMVRAEEDVEPRCEVRKVRRPSRVARVMPMMK